MEKMTMNLVMVRDGEITTDSMKVAEYFGKRHDDVLKKIRTQAAVMSTDFFARNFAETSIEVKMPRGGTRKDPMYVLTRDGFTSVALTFNGKRAAKYREAYIEAFNKMEEALKGGGLRPGFGLPDFNNPVESARAWADATEAAQIAQQEVRQITAEKEVYREFAEDNITADMYRAAYVRGYMNHSQKIRFGKMATGISRIYGTEIGKQARTITRHGTEYTTHVNTYDKAVLDVAYGIVKSDMTTTMAEVLKNIESMHDLGTKLEHLVDGLADTGCIAKASKAMGPSK